MMQRQLNIWKISLLRQSSSMSFSNLFATASLILLAFCPAIASDLEEVRQSVLWETFQPFDWRKAK
jgi:hypothetical protein